MNKILAVIRREFIERVRTRAFIIGTLIVPAMSFGFGYLSRAFMERDTRSRNMVIVDATTGNAGQSIEEALKKLRIGKGADTLPRYNLTRIHADDAARVRDSLIPSVDNKALGGGLDGILVVTDSAIVTGNLAYYGRNVASISDREVMRETIGPVVRQERMARLGADSALIAAAAQDFRLSSQKVTAGKLTGESGMSSFWLAYFTSFVMYFSLIMYGIQVMGAVLEEKSNRIVEVLVSSITPFELLLGKVLGVAGAGLLQLAIWGGAASYLLKNLSSGQTAGAGQLAANGGTQAVAGNIPTLSGDLIAVILVFFLLGFLLYSALYAAVGSMCSTQQETQQAAQPVTIILAVGFIAMFSLINDPSNSLARTLSFIPFFSPLVIPVRYALSPLPLGEVLGAVAATIVGMIAVVWVAGRIYRVGILSYGKKATLREVISWVRTG